MTTLALSELLGATVYDPSGAASGRVREVTLAPQEDRAHWMSREDYFAYGRLAQSAT